jgi:branched-chain amino acid transport system substrate-binding protein
MVKGKSLVFCFCLLFLFSLPKAVYAEDIVLGMSAAFTGTSRALGIELYRGAMAYIEHVNRSGGVNGRKVIIKAYDDYYNPAPAIDNTIRFIEKDNVLLLFNYVGTPTVTRVLPLLKKYSNKNIYLFFPFTGAQPQREPPYDEFVFNLRASYRQETEGLVDHLVRAGRKRIAVFYQADAYGRSGWEGVRRSLAKHGLKIVGEATYARGTKHTESLREQAAILKKSGPDAIISIGVYAACAAFIRDARDEGIVAPIANVSFVGSENLLSKLIEMGETMGRDYTSGLLNSQVVLNYDDTNVSVVREYRAFMDAYNPMPPRELVDAAYEPQKYSYVGFEGFLNAKLIVEILRRMGPHPERAKIRNVVEGIKGLDLGIKTKVTYGPDKHQGLDSVYYTTVRDGKFVPMTDWTVWAQ